MSWLKDESLQSIQSRLGTLGLHSGEVACAPKRAAVLVPLFEDAEGTIRVILTERSQWLSKHPGEVSLPGGKADAEDETLVHTALREANEEMALRPADVTVTAQFPAVLSLHRLSVTPVVGFLDPSVVPALTPSPTEVASLFTMPLHHFLEDHPRHTARDARIERYMYRIHHFAHGKYDVWGLTAGILIRVAEAAYGRAADFDVVGPVVGPQRVDYSQLFFDGSAVSLRGAVPGPSV